MNGEGGGEPSSKRQRVSFAPASAAADVSSGEEDDACAAATGSAVAVARAAQRRVLIASSRLSLSAAAAGVAELQRQWATQLENDPEQQRSSLSAPAAAFWLKKRRVALVRHINSFGLPPSTNSHFWNKLCRLLDIPQPLQSSCPDVAAELVRLARAIARSDAPATVDGKRARAGPGLFTANSAKAFLERIEAVEALRGVFRDADCDGPLARAVASLVPLHTCAPSRVKLLGMPAWWVIGQHDVALVDGVLRHGWGNLAALAADETLPFAKHMALSRNEGDEDEGGDSDGEGGEGGAALTRFRPFQLRLKDLAAACPSLLLELQDIM